MRVKIGTIMTWHRRLHILIVVVLLIGGLAVTAWTDLDLRWSRQFYIRGASDHWPYGDGPPWSWMDRFGNVPGLLLVAWGIWLALSGWRRGATRERSVRAGLAIVLAIAIGPGLVVNGVMKNFWGRSRPRNVEPFRGPREYLPWYQPGGSDHGPSFPSGHTAMSFGLMIGALSISRRRPLLRMLAVPGVVAYGALVAHSRVLQGAHFLSDVVVGGAIGWLTALCFAVWLRVEEDPPPERSVS